MWPIKTILNATDFSEASNDAHEAACALARQNQAHLIVLYVAEKPVISSIEKASELSEEEFQQKLWDTLRGPREQEAGLDVEHRVEEGDPIKQIVRVAEENQVDLIVMGASGHTGLLRWLTISVTEEITRNAPCSVLMVKPTRAAQVAAAEAPAETRAAQRMPGPAAAAQPEARPRPAIKEPPGVRAPAASG